MKIKIDDSTLTTINNLKNLKLLNGQAILIIQDFKISSEMITPNKSLFSKNSPEPIKINFLTEMRIIGYNGDLKFVGVFNEDFIERFLGYNIIRLRKKWVNFEEQLNAINKKLLEEPYVEKETSKLRIINQSDLVKDMRVQDDNGNVGLVKECDDMHNIFVEYDTGGSGYYCVVIGCKEKRLNDGSDLRSLHYDPLYYKEN